MNNIALIISFIALMAFFVYVVRGITRIARKNENAKMLFKRSLIFLAISLIALIIFGITVEPSKEVANEMKQEEHQEKNNHPVPKPKEKQEQINAKKDAPMKKEEQQKVEEQITPSGGLGDTIDVFKQNYGENAGDQEMGRFKNDYIMPIFLEGKAWNIKIQFEATSQSKRTMEEALIVAKEFIPKDAQKIKEYDQPEMGRKVIEYKSELLKQRFPDFNPPGTFIVIASYGEAGKENEVFGLTIGVGNNP
ncbi:DUF2304 domain-containing protein [Anoxybacillus ayderensis]|uniref:DUF2304 domain-containing protein n=1 Tax=Anoxybacillus ayderensis TaxID=265546 RepID=UPI000A26B3BE|nr:DUF2304 domain-containing protein [Anoxybacillus ayderensis]OSX53675.1 hypothetical protein B7H16_10530 [Anoxybacillus ayderensis]